MGPTVPANDTRLSRSPEPVGDHRLRDIGGSPPQGVLHSVVPDAGQGTLGEVLGRRRHASTEPRAAVPLHPLGRGGIRLDPRRMPLRKCSRYGYPQFSFMIFYDPPPTHPTAGPSIPAPGPDRRPGPFGPNGARAQSSGNDPFPT